MGVTTRGRGARPPVLHWPVRDPDARQRSTQFGHDGGMGLGQRVFCSVATNTPVAAWFAGAWCSGIPRTDRSFYLLTSFTPRSGLAGRLCLENWAARHDRLFIGRASARRCIAPLGPVEYQLQRRSASGRALLFTLLTPANADTLSPTHWSCLSHHCVFPGTGPAMPCSPARRRCGQYWSRP